MKRCPICGSRRVRRAILRPAHGQQPITIDECMNCGEQYLDPKAVELLAYAKRRRLAG